MVKPKFVKVLTIVHRYECTSIKKNYTTEKKIFFFNFFAK